MLVEGAVEGSTSVMEGFRVDLSVMFMVFVVVVAREAPGADVVEGALLDVGGRGCCGWGSLGRVNCG